MQRVLNNLIEIVSASGMYLIGCSMIANPSLGVAGIALVTIGSVLLYNSCQSLIQTRAGAGIPGTAGVAGAGATIAAGKLSSRPQDAIWRSSVHEAGHFLAIAFLPTRPQYLFAKVTTGYGIEKNGGEVCYAVHGEVSSQGVLEGMMLVDLAGQLAELLIFGNPSVLSRNDNIAWEDRARALIPALRANGGDYVWFHAPTNDFEAHINANTLARLRNEHIERITAFLQERKDKLIEVATRLRMNHVIEANDAFEYLESLLPGDLGWRDAA